MDPRRQLSELLSEKSGLAAEIHDLEANIAGYENQRKFAKVFCESPWHSSVEIPQTVEVNRNHLWNHGDRNYAVFFRHGFMIAAVPSEQKCR